MGTAVAPPNTFVKPVTTLAGRRRAFCIYSVHHRGTYERPGLVLGLAPGGSVRGMAYRVAASEWEGVYAYLREREQPTETYVEAWTEIRLADRRRGRGGHLQRAPRLVLAHRQISAPSRSPVAGL